MATIEALAGRKALPAVRLSDAQTGNGPSTNVLDRGDMTGPALIGISTTVGATPSVTVAIEGSPNGVDWTAVAYADSASPETVSVATFTITTAGTFWKIVRSGHPWRYLRLNYSANTNVTLTADIWQATAV